MTALTQYDRIEGSALWREHATEQRRDVIVSLGDATLIITDTKERPLAHWSLAAVHRVNPGKLPAIFAPDGDSEETIELNATEHVMIDAIETLCAAIERRRPKPGRVRTASFLGILLVMVLLLLVWMPIAVRDYTLRVLPKVTRQEIGTQIVGLMQPYTGAYCFSPLSKAAQKTIQSAILGPDATLRIVPQGVQGVIGLPGGTFLADKSLVEDYEDPDVFAGFLLAEKTRLATLDPMQAVLKSAGVIATFQLLTTGKLDDAALLDYAKDRVSMRSAPVDSETLITAFQEHNLALTPYANALDITGETTLPLLEADALRNDTPISSLGDTAWVSLQGICGG